jgi:hypothetical protein
MGGRPAHLKGLDCGLILVKFEGFFEKKTKRRTGLRVDCTEVRGFFAKKQGSQVRIVG